jgi:hypothetical protein
MTEDTSSFSELMTPQETAKLRRCSTRKQEVERATGRGPAYIRDGARIWYRRSDVEAFLRANLRGADPEARRGRPRKPATTAA